MLDILLSKIKERVNKPTPLPPPVSIYQEVRKVAYQRTQAALTRLTVGERVSLVTPVGCYSGIYRGDGKTVSDKVLLRTVSGRLTTKTAAREEESIVLETQTPVDNVLDVHGRRQDGWMVLPKSSITALSREDTPHA